MAKRVALVTSHFPPSNVAGVHRARLWAQYLPEFGWMPTIVTTHWRHYEQRLDRDLEAMVPQDMRVIRTPALPTRPLRIVGEMGVRAFWWHYRALCSLAARREVDFVLITIPSNFSAPLGRLIQRKFGIPYGIDYQDPWVHEWPGVRRFASKAWVSLQLSKVLEPWSVREAALITGVASGHFAGMLDRNPDVAARAEIAAMPIGGSPRDFETVEAMPRRPLLFDREDGAFHLIYAGTYWPAAAGVFEAFLQGLAHLQATAPAVARRLRIHFVGTGRLPDDEHDHRIMPIARRLGVDGLITEQPNRMSYVDVLNHLLHAHANVIIGSTDPHYTPSKVFQAVMSRHPVLALLHEASTAVEMIRSAHAGRVLMFTAGALPSPPAVAQELQFLVEQRDFDANRVDWSVFEAYSARQSACALAGALDRACARPPAKR